MSRTIDRTIGLLRRAMDRRDGRAAAVLLLVAYPLIYLYSLGHLTLSGTGGVDLLVVSDPLARVFAARAPFSYEPVGRLTLGPVLLLLSPLNLLISVGLAVLVAANAAVAVVSWRAPKACGVDARAGPFAGVLSLLSGSACCGPTILLIVGIQATGTIISAFSVLIPVAVLLLIGTLLVAGWQATDPGTGGPGSDVA